MEKRQSLPTVAADSDPVRPLAEGMLPDRGFGKGEPLLSVVLPNYNHAAYLARAIDVIAAQDTPPDEIIVIDDASTDNIRDVLAQCQLRHPNLVVLCNESNGGAL